MLATIRSVFSLISLPGGQHTSGVLYRSIRDQMDRDLASLVRSRRR